LFGFVKEPPRSKTKLPYLKNGTDYQNTVLKHAWEISNNEDFICTILGENSQLTHDRTHNYTHQLCWTWKTWETKHPPNQRWCNGLSEEQRFYRTHTDHGFGVSDGYYRWIVEDARYLSDWRWNLEQTHKLWKGGTKFYGQNNCWYTKTLIEWQ